MANTFVNSFRSEWLKKKRTASSWLVIAGGFFIPLIMLIARLVNHETMVQELSSPHFWDFFIKDCWQVMAILLLPMGVILATSLITQIEYRNNTWKQLHTSPQSLTVIFFSKYSIIFFMLIQFFVLFNIGIFLAGILPSVFSAAVPYPAQAFPFGQMLRISGSFLLCCLPIVAFQFLLSLQFKNFLVPLGAGIGLLVASLIAVRWKYGYTIPYTYCMQQFMGGKITVTGMNIHYFAWFYFSMFTLAAYLIYVRKKVKG